MKASPTGWVSGRLIYIRASVHCERKHREQRGPRMQEEGHGRDSRSSSGASAVMRWRVKADKGGALLEDRAKVGRQREH